jgi:uncharacterized protein YbcI
MSVQGERAGSVLADVSNAVVGIHRECYGRGPTKAKTYAFDNYVLTVLEDIFTTVEQTLIANGHEQLVRAVRLTFQASVADRFKEAVGAALDRQVVSYHSQVIMEPPTGFEIFILEDRHL